MTIPKFGSRIWLMLPVITLLVSFQNCSSFDAAKTGGTPVDAAGSDVPADVPADPNGPLSVFVRNTSVRQGADLVFKVELNKKNDVAVVVDVETKSGTAISAVDYQDVKKSVTIPAGSLGVEVTVPSFIFDAATSNKVMSLQATSSSTGAILQKEGFATIAAWRKLENFKRVGVGFNHSCAITSQSTVKCWGLNSYGQLGRPADAGSLSPIEVTGLGGVEQISLGVDTTCVRTFAGGVKCWGHNNLGQLGDGTGNDSEQPRDVVGLTGGLTGAKSVHVGEAHACALTNAGTVKCWGSNSHGQLGTGTKSDSASAVDVVGVSDATQVTTGGLSSCAIVSQGRVKCWGANYVGQLGNGTIIESPTPVEVSGLTGATQVLTRTNSTCALTTGGVVKCWGAGGQGQLGVGSSQNSSVPVEVVGATSLTQISVGFSHACGLTARGDVKCWGSNNQGQLGNGKVVALGGGAVVDVSGLGAGVKEISSYGFHSCAITAQDTVKCWGLNDEGAVGSGAGRMSSVSLDLAGLSGSKQIASGFEHSCAITAQDTVKCWGRNDNAQLGVATATAGNSSTPLDVSGLSAVKQLAVGTEHTCALKIDGSVKCWGGNSQGQLGTPSAGSSVPLDVSGLSGIKQIAAGGYHSCVITAQDTVKCWGGNTSGQIGNGTTTVAPSAVDVPSLSGVKQIVAGTSHTCALKNDGSAMCWGSGIGGQLGDGDSQGQVRSPVSVVGLSAAKKIGAGSYHSCAITAQDTVKCWGSGSYGQLGHGSTSNSLAAVDVSGLTQVKAITLGDVTTCALTTQNKVKCWGRNNRGQLGDGTFANSAIPVETFGSSDVSQVEAGGAQTLTLFAGGRVRQTGLFLRQVSAPVDVTTSAF